eukprot:g15463.t1
MEQTMSVIVEDEPEAINAKLFSSKSVKTPKPASSRRRRASLIPSKEGRVKVAVRCRPPFEDELEENGDFFPIVNCPKDEQTPRIELFLGGKSRRNFYYDHVFGPDAEQLDVYDKVAGPIVHGALNGLNGAVFAYGQTGTGKTYTMGILDELEETSLGIIPRSLRHVFGHIDANSENSKWTVTVSFLQIYLENVQDLLAASANEVPLGSENDAEVPVLGASLKIRENPSQGFYVEGLQKYVVESVQETIELINFGLRNRVMAPTLMNTTSSRSHTVLTLEIEHVDIGDRGAVAGYDIGGAKKFRRILRGKLLLVDLAGSERVRRTTSQGARLEEAKSINQSLSALGNVVAALADPNAPHIPFRDSNLTKLAQNSLGGNANTALIATIGPAMENNSETLSTLMFASRCMRLRSKPVVNEEVDYAQMVSILQNRLAGAVQLQKEREVAQQDHYEQIIQELNLKIESLQANNSGTIKAVHASDLLKPDAHDSISTVNTYGVDLVRTVYDTIRHITTETSVLLTACCQIELKNKNKWESEQHDRVEREIFRKEEIRAMSGNDPLGKSKSLGPHLKTIGADEAFARVESRYGMLAFSTNENADSTSKILPNYDSSLAKLVMGRYMQFASENIDCTHADLIRIYTYPTFDEAMGSNAVERCLDEMQKILQENIEAIYLLITQRNDQMIEAKDQIASQLVEQRQREEEVVNWSYVLKHLLSTNSALKEEINALKRGQTQRLREHIKQQQTDDSARSKNNTLTNELDINSIPNLTVNLNFDVTEKSQTEEEEGSRKSEGDQASGTTLSSKQNVLTKHQKHTRKIAALRAKAAEERKRHMVLEKARETRALQKQDLGSLSWVRRGQGAGILRNVDHYIKNGKLDQTVNLAEKGSQIIKNSMNLIEAFWSTTGEFLLYGETQLMTAASLKESRNRKRREDGRYIASDRNLKLSKAAQETYSQLDTYMKTLNKEKHSLHDLNRSAESNGTTSFSQMDRYLQLQERQAKMAKHYNKGESAIAKQPVAPLLKTTNEQKGHIHVQAVQPPKSGISVMARVKGWENKVGRRGKVGSPKKHEMVEPYIPRDITVESLTEIGKGGWLMRKRPDLNGRWDVMYTTFTNGSVLSYIVLSQKGSIDLYEAEVVETISADFFSDDERQKYPHAFALNSRLLESPLIMSAPNESSKQEWIHALKSTIEVKRRQDKLKKHKRRSSLIETVLTDKVILEGILMKKAISAKVFKNWKVRIFKLQEDTLDLDYFDVQLYDKIDCNKIYSTPTILSAHRAAVDNDINPIWFQKKCRYTFQCFKHLGEDGFDFSASALDSTIPDKDKAILADFGTDSEAHRATWVKALMKFNAVSVA